MSQGQPGPGADGRSALFAGFRSHVRSVPASLRVARSVGHHREAARRLGESDRRVTWAQEEVSSAPKVILQHHALSGLSQVKESLLAPQNMQKSLKNARKAGFSHSSSVRQHLRRRKEPLQGSAPAIAKTVHRQPAQSPFLHGDFYTRLPGDKDRDQRAHRWLVTYQKNMASLCVALRQFTNKLVETAARLEVGGDDDVALELQRFSHNACGLFRAPVRARQDPIERHSSRRQRFRDALHFPSAIRRQPPVGITTWEAGNTTFRDPVAQEIQPHLPPSVDLL